MKDSLQLKNKIIQRIIEIDDAKLLKTIDAIFSSSDKNISKFLTLSNEKFEQEVNGQSTRCITCRTQDREYRRKIYKHCISENFHKTVYIKIYQKFLVLES